MLTPLETLALISPPSLRMNVHLMLRTRTESRVSSSACVVLTCVICKTDTHLETSCTLQAIATLNGVSIMV